ncbi:arginase [Candidatus Woesearchaeota archaeon]|nr:arginase [Candidatus Woesearchaeota archaeon]
MPRHLALPPPRWNPEPVTNAFDPDAPAPPGSGLFGLGSPLEKAAVRVLPVPFEATTSYRRGTAGGPLAIEAASHQVDLYDRQTGRPYESGIHLAQVAPEVVAWNEEASALAQRLHAQEDSSAERETMLARVNAIGAELNTFVFDRTRESLNQGQLPVTLGGDHSVPYGAIMACAEEHPGMGLLHFDAHADLRDSYEGFTWSHASVLHNVIGGATDLGQIVQVGVRDLGESEARAIEGSGGAIHTVFDDQWARTRLDGLSLRELVRRNLDRLPTEVYLTFDVDGLDPSLCPQTGTPVPGGLTWHEAMLWLEELTNSGRRIVGLDLCEVSPGPHGDLTGQNWDAAVGARLLYRLIGTALLTRGKGSRESLTGPD